MKTDGGHEIDEKDLEEMGMAAGEEPKTSNTSLEGNYYGRMTQPVVNFLLAKLALNAEIYMFDDWTAVIF